MPKSRNQRAPAASKSKRHNVSFDLPALRRNIKPARLNWFPRLGSTNNHAAILRKRGSLFAPSIVLAGHQTAGRGRGSNTWWSGPGSLTVTFVLPIHEQIAPHQLPLIAGLAVRNATAKLTGNAAVQLKWPNDLLHEGKKFAGLLCERILKADLIGLGLNINTQINKMPSVLRNQVTSLSEIAHKPLDMTEVLSAIWQELSAAMVRGRQHPFAAVLHEYDRHHALVDRKIKVIVGHGEPPIIGRCRGLDSIGRLIVKTPSKIHHVISGHVILS